MRKKTFSEEQIALALRDAETGTGRGSLMEVGSVRVMVLQQVEEEVPGYGDR